jgi:hypothetical protein
LDEGEGWRRVEFSGPKFQPRSAKEKSMNSTTLFMALVLMTSYALISSELANLRQYEKAIAALNILIELNPRSEKAKAMLLQIENEIKRK